jgi:hypothetical protein
VRLDQTLWQFAGDDMHEIEVGKGIAKVTLTAPAPTMTAEGVRLCPRYRGHTSGNPLSQLQTRGYR